jgi:hypothetical protein
MHLGHRVCGQVVDDPPDLVAVSEMQVEPEAANVLGDRRDRTFEDGDRLIESVAWLLTSTRASMQVSTASRCTGSTMRAALPR